MSVEPYPWQEPCIAVGLASLAKHGVFANGSEMGVGKTIQTCVMAKRRNQALFVACPKSVISDWTYWGDQVGVKVIALNYEKLRAGRTPHGKWLVKGKAFQWTLPDNTDLAFDECFPAGTKVSTPDGPRPIETLEVGDLVSTPDGPRKVLRRMPKTGKFDTIQIHHAHGTLKCTPSHKIATPMGWKRAGDLSLRDSVFVDLEASEPAFLLEGLRIQEPRGETKTIGSDEQEFTGPKQSFEGGRSFSDDPRQPDEVGSASGLNEFHPEGDGPCAKGERWERQRHDSGSGESPCRAGSGMDSGVDSPARATPQRVAHWAEVRLGEPRPEVGGGSRRKIAPVYQASEPGPQESCYSRVSRLATASGLEQDGISEPESGGFGAVSPILGIGKGSVVDQVFDIEVDQAHVYFAECCLVSNCHKLGGIDTQQSALLVAAKRQKIPHYLLSGTLLENPLKGKAIGFSLGLHNLLGFWTWAKKHGVTQGHFGMEWPYLLPSQAAKAVAVMENIRIEMGDKFFRIRKSEVPGFPEKQIIPFLVPTDDMPEEETLDGGKYGYHARMVVELLKVPGLVDKARDLLDASGHSVTIFVNYLDTLNALIKAFPTASIIRGGQSLSERADNIQKFQRNDTTVCLIMIQAGGTGVSLHDLHGVQRSSIICPGNSASEFLQAIDRIHRAGSQSTATIYVAFASGVPVERRQRDRMEAKINNLSALNDLDLGLAESVTIINNYDLHTANDLGTLSASPGAPVLPSLLLPDKCLGDKTGRPGLPGGTPACSHHHDTGAGKRSDPASTGGPGDERDSRSLPPGEMHEKFVHPPGSPDSRRPQQPPGVSPDVQALVHQPCSPDSSRPQQMVKILPLPPVEATAEVAALTQQLTESLGNHVVRKHARSSPSKLKNLEICPSYQGDNDGPVHPITLRGTAMHEALETGNDSGLDPANTEGVTNPAAAEEKRLVQMCRDFQDGETVPGEIVITEPHLKTHDADVQGFADRVVLEPSYILLDAHTGKEIKHRRSRIRDYKMGWNPVDGPDLNPQAIAYTVAVFLQYPDVTEVNFAFLIPRIDAVLEHTFQRSDLPALKLRIGTIAERVRKLAGKEFNVNNDNCLYCGRKATCTALHAKVLTLARGFDEADKLPLPAVFNPGQIVDAQEIAYGLNMARIAQSWAESWNSYALKLRLELGIEIPGYDAVERSAKREVADVVGTYQLVSSEFGVTQEEFLAACKTSITKLEDAVKEHAGRGDKAKAAKIFTDRMLDEGLLTRGASFWVLARSKKKIAKTVLPAAA